MANNLGGTITAKNLVINNNKIIVYLRGSAPFSIVFDDIESEIVFPIYTNTTCNVVYDISGQTLIGGYTYTLPISGPMPVDDSNYATKEYVDLVAGGGITPDSEYYVKGSVPVVTTGTDVIATSITAAAGYYSVQLTAVYNDGSTSATLNQTFNIDSVGIFSAIGGPITYVSGGIAQGYFVLAQTGGGFSISVGGVSASWKVTYWVIKE